MQRLQPLQNHHFGSKKKIAKKVPRTTLKSDYSCSMQKTALKKINNRKMRQFEKFTKMGNMQRLQRLQNHHFGSKVKISKKVPKKTPKFDYSCSMQKTALKNNQYSENEAFLKLHKKWPTCKGYSPCKIITLGPKLKLQKKCQNRPLSPVTVVLCKKRLYKKTMNNRKRRQF